MFRISVSEGFIKEIAGAAVDIVKVFVSQAKLFKVSLAQTVTVWVPSMFYIVVFVPQAIETFASVLFW